MSSYYNINGVFNGFLPGMVCPFIGKNAPFCYGVNWLIKL